MAEDCGLETVGGYLEGHGDLVSRLIMGIIGAIMWLL